MLALLKSKMITGFFKETSQSDSTQFLEALTCPAGVSINCNNLLHTSLITSSNSDLY